MKNITTVKRKSFSLRLAALTLCLALACSFAAPAIFSARAATTSGDVIFNDFLSKSFTVENNQFASSSGAYPQSPSSWTGGYAGSFKGSNTVAGVIDLTSEEYLDEEAYEAIKLDRYQEYAHKELPKTPFGYNTTLPNGKLYFPGTNKKVLMINTNGSETAYGYSTGELSLKARSFYKFSAYVKTGEFSQSQGAAIKLSGFIDESEIGFWNINTLSDVKKEAGVYELNSDNLYGWKQYTIYVATGYNDETVTLTLSVGDNSEEHTCPARGYAFFDNVEAYELSATTFYQESKTTQVNPARFTSYDMNNAPRLTVQTDDGETEIGGFTQGLKGWVDIKEDEDGNTYGGALKAIHNGMAPLAEDNTMGLTFDPVTPIGKTPYGSDNANNILVMYAKNKVSAGLRSLPFTIKRDAYYRLGIWANAAELKEGSTASIAVSGQSTIASDNYKLATVAVDDISVNAGSDNRYNWKEFAFYIKGSSLKDVELSVELWLGRTTKSAGIVMFDDVTLETLTYSQYNDNNSGGTVVTVDAAAADTGVTNGNFATVGDYEEYKWPLAPADWTYHTAADAGTAGFSAQDVNTDGVASGIIPTDEEHFEANRNNYKGAPNPTDGRDYSIPNVLLIGSNIKTAVSYASSSFIIKADSYNKLSVNLQVRDIEGYGASLVLKDGVNVVDTIENITSTGNSFKTFTFYVKGTYGDKPLTLEIWLGNIDRNVNRSKLSSGYVYVANVSLDTSNLTEEEYINQRTAFKKAMTGNTKIDYVVLDLSYSDLTLFDRYSDETVKTAYKWNASTTDPNTLYKAGAFDPTILPLGQNEIPSYFAKAYETAANKNNNVLYIHNINPGATTLVTRESINLTATKYYIVSVSMLIDVPAMTDSQVGVRLEMPGIGRVFENIGNTHDTVGVAGDDGSIAYDKIFKTYNFYIAVGTEDIGSTLSLTLGGGEYPNQYVAGRLFVSDINIQEITNITYEEETKDVEEDDEFIRFNSFISEGSEEAPENPDEENPDETPPAGDENTNAPVSVTNAWWFVPSLLFAVAIVIAIVGVIIRKIIEKRSRRKTKEKTTSYDRKHTLTATYDETGSVEVEANKNTEVKEVKVIKSDSGLDEFDEDAEPVKKPIEKVTETTVIEPTVEEKKKREDKFSDNFDD